MLLITINVMYGKAINILIVNILVISFKYANRLHYFSVNGKIFFDFTFITNTIEYDTFFSDFAFKILVVTIVVTSKYRYSCC